MRPVLSPGRRELVAWRERRVGQNNDLVGYALWLAKPECAVFRGRLHDAGAVGPALLSSRGRKLVAGPRPGWNHARLDEKRERMDRSGCEVLCRQVLRRRA